MKRQLFTSTTRKVLQKNKFGSCVYTSYFHQQCHRLKYDHNVDMIRCHYFSTQQEKNDEEFINEDFSNAPAKVSISNNGTNNNNDVIKITHTTPYSHQSNNNIPNNNKHNTIGNNHNNTELVDSLLKYTSTLVEPSETNIIAFSGGVDSSLAAALVKQVFDYEHNNNNGIEGVVKAVIGVSTSLPQRQLDLARSIASHIDIDLIEVSTDEGSDEKYIANDGTACLVCKNHLYSALNAVANKAKELGNNERNNNVTLFNGTNADDTKDPTRLGLISAKAFSVKSPLIHISKEEVRRAARHLNLPNWNYAASPCLRSRLAIGVEATYGHLVAVNKAEERVRKLLSLDETINLRVRMLSGKKAMVELDKYVIDGHYIKNQPIFSIEEKLREEGFIEFCRELGFTGGIGVRAFKTGSVSIK